MEAEYSVLMSVYEKEQALYLRESIESMLSQTVMPKDFVIVCDGPLTEELDGVLSHYEKNYRELFQIIRLPENMGLGRALNEGMKHCRYEYVARMDSDDISLCDRMEKQLAVLEDRQVDVVSGTLLEFDREHPQGNNKRQLPQQQEEILKFAKRRNPFNHPCVTYRKSSVLEVGGYSHFPGFEDYFLWVEMLQRGMKGYNLQDIVLKMRTDGMHSRRGGWKYAGLVFRFRFHLLKIGFCSVSDFVVATGGHLVVSLMPDRLRKSFYNTVLR